MKNAWSEKLTSLLRYNGWLKVETPDTLSWFAKNVDPLIVLTVDKVETPETLSWSEDKFVTVQATPVKFVIIPLIIDAFVIFELVKVLMPLEFILEIVNWFEVNTSVSPILYDLFDGIFIFSLDFNDSLL